MRLAWAFFKRDSSIALSYRISFAAQLAGNVFLLTLVYFVGRTIGAQALPSLQAYGGNFLAFVLIGIALTDCVLVSLVGFAAHIRESQTTGTLEATLMSPVPLPVILVYSSLWNYFLSAVRFVLYLAVGAWVFGVDIQRADLGAAATIFLLTVVSFMGLGILWAGVVLLVKRGESLMTLGGHAVLLVTGVLFPVTLLPPWVQHVSAAIPLTYALEGMRFALIQGRNLNELASTIVTLTVFAVVFLTIGIAGFEWAVRVAKRSGSLVQY